MKEGSPLVALLAAWLKNYLCVKRVSECVCASVCACMAKWGHACIDSMGDAFRQLGVIMLWVSELR